MYNEYIGYDWYHRYDRYNWYNHYYNVYVYYYLIGLGLVLEAQIPENVVDQMKESSVNHWNLPGNSSIGWLPAMKEAGIQKTYPPSVQQTLTSRFEHGVMLAWSNADSGAQVVKFWGSGAGPSPADRPRRGWRTWWGRWESLCRPLARRWGGRVGPGFEVRPGLAPVVCWHGKKNEKNDELAVNLHVYSMNQAILAMECEWARDCHVTSQSYSFAHAAVAAQHAQPTGSVLWSASV